MSGNQSGDPGTLGEQHVLLASSIPIVAGWAFLGFGAAITVGGILLAVDDAAGLALVVFGTLFAGAGILSEHLFLVAEERTAPKAENMAGRLIAEDERDSHWQLLAAWLWSGFAVLSVVAALIWGGIAAPVAMSAVVIAAAIVIPAIRRRRHRRHFAGSQFILNECPAVLGGRLTGVVETGIETSRAPAQGFAVELTCAHCWEQADGHLRGRVRRTRRRLQVLWMQSLQLPGQAGCDGRHLSIPVQFDLPRDWPPSTMASGFDRVIWELSVSATLEGSARAARFQIPVLPPKTAKISNIPGKTRSYRMTATDPSAVTIS